jgi:hypothetical protein
MYWPTVREGYQRCARMFSNHSLCATGSWRHFNVWETSTLWQHSLQYIWVRYQAVCCHNIVTSLTKVKKSMLKNIMGQQRVSRNNWRKLRQRYVDDIKNSLEKSLVEPKRRTRWWPPGAAAPPRTALPLPKITGSVLSSRKDARR